MKKIESLSQEQVAKFPEYAQKFTELGLSAGRLADIDREAMKELVARIYAEGALPPPSVIIYVNNPLHAVLAYNMIKEIYSSPRTDKVRSQVWSQVESQVESQVASQVESQVWSQVRSQVRSQVWSQVASQVWSQVESQAKDMKLEIPYFMYGQHDTPWLSFYSYFLNECNIEAGRKLIPLTELAGSVGWCVPLKDFFIVSPKPSALYRNSHERLHRDLGAAMEYEGESFLYALNGVRFEGDEIKWVTTPASELDHKEILKIKNVEQRAEVIKKVGIDKLFFKLQPTLLDSKGEMYELYKINLGGDRERVYLKMNNPSIVETHIEAVHPTVTTVNQALAWRNFGEVTNNFIEPMALT
jgi:hypothetical protein